MANEIDTVKVRNQIERKLEIADWCRYLGWAVGLLGAEMLFLMANGGEVRPIHFIIALALASVGRAANKFGNRSKRNMEWLVQDPADDRPVKIKKA